MAKLTLTDLGTTLANTAATTINNNSTLLEAALENTLSRDGTSPNQMEADLDLNNNDLLNAGIVNADVLVLDGVTVTPSDLASLPATVMLKTTYDPQGKNTDAFLASNHDVTLGTVERTVSNKLGEIVSVKDYGAVGDGAVDDTAALSAAFNSGRSILVPFGEYRITSKIVINTAGVRIFGLGFPRVGNNVLRAANIVIDNASLDYALEFNQANCTVQGLRFRVAVASTVEAMIFRKAGVESSDIDARVMDCSIEGLTNGLTVVGRGLHVKRCEFGNLTRGVALDWPASYVPNGLDNDLVETGARSYVIEDNLFHGTADWVTNTGANAQNVRSVIMQGNLGDLGGSPFTGVLVDSIIDGSIANIGNSSGTVISLSAGSRNSQIVSTRVGGILEGAASRMPNNCINIATTTANPSKNITIIGSFGPCLRNAIQIFGDGVAEGISLIGCTFDRPAQTLAGGFTPISVFNSGGTLTRVELTIIGCAFDMTGTDSVNIIGGTNSAAIEVFWVANTIKDTSTVTSTAQSAVNVFQHLGDGNTEMTMYNRKNGTWVTDGTEWFARVIAKTADVSGGGVGVAGSITLLPTTSTGAGTTWRFGASSASVRDVKSVDINNAGIIPVLDNGSQLGTSALRWSNSFMGQLTLTDGITAPGTVAGHAQIYVDTADGDLKVKFGDGITKVLATDT